MSYGDVPLTDLPSDLNSRLVEAVVQRDRSAVRTVSLPCYLHPLRNPGPMMSCSHRLTAILISRFLMNLQEANNTMMHQECFSSVGTLNFNRFIGSIASSLPAPGDASERTRYEEDDHSWDGGPAGCNVEEPSGSSTVSAR